MVAIDWEGRPRVVPLLLAPSPTARILRTPQLYTDLMKRSLMDLALGIAEEIATHCNRLVEKTAPWKLAKEPTEADRLDTVLYHLAESLRIIAILISPVCRARRMEFSTS